MEACFKRHSRGDFGRRLDRTDRAEIQSRVVDADEDAKDEVWGGYRFVVLADNKEPDGLSKPIDLGAGHSSSSETLCGRVISALKSGALLNESIGAGYIDRNWPPALKDCGAWSLTSLRQSFLNGSLTRLLDPDAILRGKIVEFIERGDFGLTSGQKPDGTYERVWYMALISPEEVAFESGVFLLKKEKAKALKTGIEPRQSPELPSKPFPQPEPTPTPDHEPDAETIVEKQTCTLHLSGVIPPEVWNRLGTKILPKLRSGMELQIGVDFRVTLKSDSAQSMKSELRQILDDLGLSGKVVIDGT